MILGNIRKLEDYPFLEKEVMECLEYARIHDLMEYSPGCYDIHGQDLFVNIVEYTTTSPENRFWEAHRQYLDLHLILHGSEQIDLSSIGTMEQKEYVEEDDFLPLVGEKENSVVLHRGDFLICFPDDGHRTAVAVKGPETVKKAIFKVKI